MLSGLFSGPATDGNSPAAGSKQAGKVCSMAEAIANFVHDQDAVAIEGFTHLICHAAGHEIIRQRKRHLTLCRMTPDIIYDQMIAAGVADKLIFSWMGNPGAGSLYAIRRTIEQADQTGFDWEEYSHFGLVSRYVAGASRLPFMPLRSYAGGDLPHSNSLIQPVHNPFNDEWIYCVPPLNPDVTIIHTQRSTVDGDCQIWGVVGCQKEAALASKRVIVVCEELVDEVEIRSDPDRTLLPGLVVDAVVVEPFACHPSYALGYYDRDNDFYLAWSAISRDPHLIEKWLQDWVYGLRSHRDYIEKLGVERVRALRSGFTFGQDTLTDIPSYQDDRPGDQHG